MNEKCELRFNIDQKLQQPIRVYLELDNFYQSHKKFVTSVPKKQLRGESEP